MTGRAGRGRMLAAAVLLACAGCGPPIPRRSQPSGTAAPQATAASRAGTIPCRPSARSVARGKPRFAPPTRREGDAVVMPVVFPDGTTAELRYPPELDLARLGVSARTSGVLADDPDTGRGVEIIYGDADGLTAGKAPVACYRGTDGGQVELWPTPDPELRFWLLFRFGAWTVAVWDGNAGRLLGHQDRARWARSLVGRETGHGWLVLRGRRPLRLGADHDGDVQLQLGDLSPRAVLLWPTRCTSRARPIPSGLGRDWFASWCLPEGPAAVHVYDSDGSFGRAVIQGLQVRDVRHARPPGRYHIVP
jgi:hypothetical protein